MILQVYADTSVFGGAFDAAFAAASQEFFNQVRNGRFRLVTSIVVREEIAMAPQPVRNLFTEMLARAESIDLSEAALRLRQAYLAAGIVGPASATDALHVALASVTGCNLIVSWNFRHIVHFQKIPLYNAVNTLHGYGHLAIHSPQEVIA
jgi:predicted nucleic acid-binding protein